MQFDSCQVVILLMLLYLFKCGPLIPLSKYSVLVPILIKVLC